MNNSPKNNDFLTFCSNLYDILLQNTKDILYNDHE